MLSDRRDDADADGPALEGVGRISSRKDGRAIARGLEPDAAPPEG
jgi:hypothetical protein